MKDCEATYLKIVNIVLEKERVLGSLYNKRVELIILSKHISDMITEHLSTNTNMYKSEGVNPENLFGVKTICGYEVKVIESLSYTTPIQFIY